MAWTLRLRPDSVAGGVEDRFSQFVLGHLVDTGDGDEAGIACMADLAAESDVRVVCDEFPLKVEPALSVAAGQAAKTVPAVCYKTALTWVGKRAPAAVLRCASCHHARGRIMRQLNRT